MLRGSAVRSAAKALGARRFVSSAPTQTKYATLASGITVATESNPNATSATIGVWYTGGSRSEHPYSNGVAALTTSLLAAQDASGVLLSAQNGRETNGVVAQTTNDNVAAAAKTLADIVSNPGDVLSKADLAAAKAKLSAQAARLELDPSRMVVEHLNATAFQGYSLGLPVTGTADSIAGLELQDSERFLDSHLVGSNVVIAASGNFNHDQLVETLDAAVAVKQGAKPHVKPASFLGSEIKMRDDTMPKAYVTLAAQGEAVSSPAYYVAKVAAAIFGSFDQHSPVASFTSPKLASIVQEYHIVDKYTHFSTSYSDTGLWGFNAEISNVGSVDEFVHFTLKEWNRLSVSISDAEVARGKAAVKTALLSELASTHATASDIASKVLLAGYRSSLSEVLEKIDAIDTAAVKQWARATLWDKDIVIASTGQNEALMDYNRWRNGMAMMRW